MIGRSQYLPENVGTVFDVVVKAVSTGKVTPADLAVELPEGTEVNDMVQQVTYPAGKQDLAVSYRIDKQVPQSRIWWIVGNALVVVVIAGLLLWRYLARNRASS
jgi:hypothetical protein